MATVAQPSSLLAQLAEIEAQAAPLRAQRERHLAEAAEAKRDHREALRTSDRDAVGDAVIRQTSITELIAHVDEQLQPIEQRIAALQRQLEADRAERERQERAADRARILATRRSEYINARTEAVVQLRVLVGRLDAARDRLVATGGEPLQVATTIDPALDPLVDFWLVYDHAERQRRRTYGQAPRA